MADRYKKVHHEGGAVDSKPKDESRNARGGDDDDKRKGGKKCCFCFGITHGYHMYAIFDAIFTFGIFMLLCLGVMKDDRMFAVAMIILFSYLPNVIIYFV